MFTQNLINFSTSKYFAFTEIIKYDNQQLSLPLLSTIDKPYTVINFLPNRNSTVKVSSNSLLSDTPKYQKCTTLFLHLFILKSLLLQQLNSKFHLPCYNLYQRHCQTLCDPHLNWHYFLSLQNPDTNSSNSESSKLIIPRNTYTRNAVYFDSSTNKTSILVRFQWISINSTTSQNFNQIQTISTKLKLNLENSPCPVIVFKSTPQKFRTRQSSHIIRLESDPAPSMFLHYRIVERVNGTLVERQLVQGENFLEVISETPNALIGPFGITSQRWLKVDYSSPVAVNKLLFLTGKPQPIGYSFSFLFKPLTFWIWMNCFGSFFILTLLIKLLLAPKLTVIEVAFAFLLPLLDQSMPEKFWRAHSKQHYLFITRFIIITWLLCCLLLSNLYRSFITGYLIQPSMTVPPKTFNELANSKYALAFQDSAQGNVQQAIFTSIDQLAKSNQSRRHLPLDITEVITNQNFISILLIILKLPHFSFKVLF